MDGYQALREHGVRANKRLGQHLLVDPQAIAKIVDAAALDERDTVLEVGPGPGTLTIHLARRAGKVIAVELDEQMLAPLRASLSDASLLDGDKVRIVHGDILEQDISSLVGGGPYKVVANLPYYITSAVLRHILEARNRPRLMVVTVQREVAERIVGLSQRRGRRRAKPAMSLLAVSVQFYGVPHIVARIPAGAFRPMPAVDSAVIRLEVYDPLPWGPVDKEAFFRTARAGFAQRRKQLQNALAHDLDRSSDQVQAALDEAGIDGRRRAETLSIAEWVTLSRALYPGA
jgi:16S rRNA (adenine1518-N6/adenine1519-N6)-dimethyltransferase